MPKKLKDRKRVKVLFMAMGVVLVVIAVWAIALSASSDPESGQPQANKEQPEQQLPQEDYPAEQGYAQDSSYVGLTEEQAIQRAKSSGTPNRIVSRDGEQYPLTMDLRQDRINFTIENGKVTKAEYY